MDISELKRLEYIIPAQRHPWEKARALIIVQLLQQFISQKPVSIADIGSGDAYIYTLLAQRKIVSNYSAIDTAYTGEIVQALQNQTGPSSIKFHKTINDFLQTSNNNVTNPVYLCLDVLEHLKEEKEVLDSITTGISSQAALYIFTVPAYNTLFSAHDVLLGHYRRYTKKQLNNLCKKHNLKVIESGYFFSSLLLIRWLQKKLSLQPKKTIDHWNRGKLVTAVITGLLMLDFNISRIFKLIGITIPGLSCYCICQKQPS